jgi:hypothetical protein
VKVLVAWHIPAHEKGRSGLAIADIFVAILLMFLQLGFNAYWTGVATPTCLISYRNARR